MAQIERLDVLWFGELPSVPTRTEFKNRGLRILPASGNVDANQFISARAAVFRFGAQNLTDVRKDFERFASDALNHGLLIYFLAENDAVAGHLTDQSWRRSASLRWDALRTEPTVDYEIAERARHHDPGFACDRQLEIKPQEILERLDPSSIVLLRRAFQDCVSIELEPLLGGRTALAFVVYATFRDSVVGPRPLPFFVKLGERTKIEVEKNNYRHFAIHFIPFYLCPNLDFDRCLSGFEQAIIVGRFVDKSESLWHRVRQGQAHSAIHSLFDSTLHGWRTQAFARGTQPTPGPIALALGKEVFDYARVQPPYLELAKTLGATKEPIEVWELLIGRKNQCFRTAPMHGDLHGENVRVRGADAIIIDLGSVTRGPLAADPAQLETWLAFEVPPGIEDTPEERMTWQARIDELYRPDHFRQLPPSLLENEKYYWLWNSVRQIRMMGLAEQACETEYQTAVAMFLLRRMMYARDDPGEHFRRAYGYLIACRLAENLSQNHAK